VRVLRARRGALLSMFVADGAGSAALGGEGAALAVDSAARSIEARLGSLDGVADEMLLRDIVAQVRADVIAASAARERKPRDLACTFLGVLSTPEVTLVAQIGDGGVVLDTGAGLEVALAPMAGEYANTTRFVTDDDALEAMASRAWPSPALRVAAFSDGLQRLAIDMARLTPHAPLFDRLFATVRAASAAQESELEPALERFLNRPEVNERTDDDKTLALAVMLS